MNHSFAPSPPPSGMRFASGTRQSREDDLGVVVEVRVVQEAGGAHDLETGRVRLDEEERLLALGEGEHDVEARGRPRS